PRGAAARKPALLIGTLNMSLERPTSASDFAPVPLMCRTHQMAPRSAPRAGAATGATGGHRADRGASERRTGAMADATAGPDLGPLLDSIAFDPAGLVPAIAQQHDTGEVLMMALMNRDSVAETLATGRACYWS